MIRVNEVKFGIHESFNEKSLLKKLALKAKVREEDILSYKIVRESIDARKDIVFSYTVDFELHNMNKYKNVNFTMAPLSPVPIHERLSKEEEEKLKKVKPPAVIGFGPAGMFAALQLAKVGLKPLVFEMGQPVEVRDQDVERFWKTGQLNPKSNVQFGEGGAGTYSDGKLTTRIKDPRVEFLLDALVDAGAQPEIRYKQKPHVGTDVLKKVVKNIRQQILDLGGQIFFNSEVTDLYFTPDTHAIYAIQINNQERYDVNDVVAATGHSARAFYKVLHEKGLSLSQKPFAVGVRIEHPQEIINASQYGKDYKSERLGAAEYKLSHQTKNGRSVYSFCMCPGGVVVASASEDGHLVVNGMSYSKRDLYNANSALLVTVEPSDFQSDHPLAGIEFQRAIEKKAYEVGGSDYTAPIQTLASFIGPSNGKGIDNPYAHIGSLDYNQQFANMLPTYQPKIVDKSFKEIFPHFILEALGEAIPAFGKKIKGYDDPRALITAAETRSSAPVRVNRDINTFEALGHIGFYPCGEGAGYAGGITSAAVDGIKVAEQIIKKYL